MRRSQVVDRHRGWLATTPGKTVQPWQESSDSVAHRLGLGGECPSDPGEAPPRDRSGDDYILRYRDWRIAKTPKAANPSATAVSRNLPSGCVRIVCIAPSSPGVFWRSKLSVA